MRRRARYRHILAIGDSDEGLYLSVFFLFRFGHPPLFIPWADVTAVEQDNRLIGKTVKLSFSKAPVVPLEIVKKLAEDLKADAGGGWSWDSAAV